VWSKNSPFIFLKISQKWSSFQYLFIYLFIYLFASGNMAHKKHEHDRQGQKRNDENTNIKEHTKDTHTHRKQLK